MGRCGGRKMVFMEEQTMKRQENMTAVYAAAQVFFWMDLCMAISFAAVYLQGLGYNNTQLGAIMAVGNIAGALMGPALAALIDQHDRLTADKLNVPILTVQAAALVLMLLCPVKGIVTTVCFMAYLAFCLPVNAMNLKLCVDAEHAGASIDYGFARGIGSLAYVLISVLLGELIDRTSVHILPAVGLVVVAGQLAANARMSRRLRGLPGAPTAEQGTSVTGNRSMWAFIRGNGRFCVLLAGTAILFFAHNTTCNFFINVTENVGGSTTTMGYLNAFMAAVEIPVMLLFSRVCGGRRSSSVLWLSFAAFALKALAVALAPNVPCLFAAQVLQAPSYALYTAAIVNYVNETIPYEDSAKGQSLAFSMTTIGAVLASLIGGWMYDRFTVTVTLLAAFAFAAVGAVIACLGTVEGPQSKDSPAGR